MRCHSVRFWRSPERSLNVSSVANVKLATACPPDVNRVSGSRPRRPTRIALLTDMRVPPVLKREVIASIAGFSLTRRRPRQRGPEHDDSAVEDDGNSTPKGKGIQW